MMAGGSFDACRDHSVAVQAAIIALQVKRPVQLAWSRAEEIMRLPPRAPARAKLTATLKAPGGIDALVTRIAVPATNHEVRARLFDQSPADEAQGERNSVLKGKRVSVRVDIGGGRTIKKNTH